MFFCQFKAFSIGYSPLFLQVVLVPHQQYFQVRIPVWFHFIQPFFQICECASSGDVVYQQGANGTPIVGSSDRMKVFLSSRIPYLQLDIIIIYGYGFGPELNTDGDLVGGSDFVLDELEDDAGLADSSVPYHNKLEKVMVILDLHYNN